MALENITIFSVGNGNCSLIEAPDFVMIIDLNKGEEFETSYEMLEPFFRKKDGRKYIDILCISHGDRDHCLDFKKFKQEVDRGNLVIGSIWHQGFDRTKHENLDDLSEDYLELRNEINRREKINDPGFGDLVQQPKAGQDQGDLFEKINLPDSFEVQVLSPFEGDDESSEFDHNDLSIVLKVVFQKKSWIFTSDSTSIYWQRKILPLLLDKPSTRYFGESEILIVSHHGSYTFFGEDRDVVRNADPEPDNYKALKRIAPKELVLSAKEKFPISKDQSGDEPPHYAAYKWYHKWLRENRGVLETDKHPKCFTYTSEGNVRWELNNGWHSVENWKLPVNEDKSKERLAAALAGSRSGVVQKPWCNG